ncbi:hypothetical protein CH63R_03512 [Colletotrichum higginsianum IMI 349063]|uniref:Uncharacterized protein n=3 Tax=Colletotrichum higginsianum TaxID=80884 RepID=A0A1B7YRX8_COLHI|nr:hypothetical protein CH63R_03512 [Colletotrichum higginsianum IMI 349063]OBR14786.1 hypothetical protein CH63R_03512 [Colletotrichum higginsianum IMI 349063]
MDTSPGTLTRRICNDSDEDRYGSDNDDKDEDEDDDSNDINGHAIQLNIPLVLPPPIDRQLLSLCFHSSWRTRSQLRFHFRNVSEVPLDDDKGSDTNQDPESESDPEHCDTRLTIVTYDPIVAPSPSITISNTTSRRLLLASSAAALLVFAIAFVFAILSGFDPLHYPLPPLRPITFRGLAAVVQPYVKLIHLLDLPNTTLPAVENEFFELYLSTQADVNPSLCLKVVNLLDDANEHLARLLVGLNAPYMGNTVYTLRDDLILMSWSIDQQRQR